MSKLKGEVIQVLKTFLCVIIYAISWLIWAVYDGSCESIYILIPIICTVPLGIDAKGYSHEYYVSN